MLRCGYQSKGEVVSGEINKPHHNTGRKLTQEHKDKISRANKGKKRGPKPAEAIEKQANALRGRKQSPEHVAKRAQAIRDRMANDPSYKEKLSKAARSPERIEATRQLGYRNRGRVHSEEQNQGQREARKTFRHTEESKAKIGAASKRNWDNMTEEQRRSLYEKWQKASYKPTNIERMVAETLKADAIDYTPHPWIYVNSDGGRHVLRPDFLLPEHDLIVEVNGCYWHGCDPCYGDKGRKDRIHEDELRKILFEEKGYHVIFLWEHDIKAGLTMKMLAESGFLNIVYFSDPVVFDER